MRSAECAVGTLKTTRDARSGEEKKTPGLGVYGARFVAGTSGKCFNRRWRYENLTTSQSKRERDGRSTMITAAVFKSR